MSAPLLPPAPPGDAASFRSHPELPGQVRVPLPLTEARQLAKAVLQTWPTPGLR
jgi:hypothetical protein